MRTKIRRYFSREQYLLNDTFAVDVAAGAVNGTVATPGPGTRTVNDVGGTISVANGGLSGGGNGAWGDERVLLNPPAIARTAGRVLLFRVTTDSGVGDGPVVGFAKTATPTTPAGGWEAAWYPRTIEPVVYAINGTTQLAVATGAASTLYRGAISLRDSGFFLFQKTDGNWVLLGLSSIGNTATLYAALGYKGVPASVADNIRIPRALWLPAPLASDSFNRADGALGSTDGAGHAEANGGGGRAWAGATWAIASNAAVNTPTAGAEQLADPGLEANYTAGLCDSLIKPGNGTVEQSADVHGGAKAQQITAVGINNRLRYDVTVTAGQWQMFSLWGKRSAGTSGTVVMRTYNGVAVSVGRAITSAGYTQLTEVARAAVADFQCQINENSATSFDTVIVDDYSLKPLTLSELFASLSDLGTPNVMADVNVTLTSGTQAGLVLCLDDADNPANFLLCYHNGTNLLLEKCVAGTYTTLINTAATYSAGATLRVAIRTESGALKIRCYYGSTLAFVGTEQTVSDAGIISNTKHGLFSTYSGNSLDNFVCWATGNEGQHSILDKWSKP